jgi:hypothetical protein
LPPLSGVWVEPVIALAYGYRPIEFCWMTWLIQLEGRKIRMERYRAILPKM